MERMSACTLVSSNIALGVLRAIESLLLDSVNRSITIEEMMQNIKTVHNVFSSDFDIDKLQCELKFLPGILDTAHIRNVTK